MPIQLIPAQSAHRPMLAQLLVDNHLQANDLPECLSNFWLAFDNDQLIGSAGVEAFGSIGLLRSICVTASHRNRGVARQLYDIAIKTMLECGIQHLYLLTTTADVHFSRLGFSPIDRAETPEVIRHTAQFSSLCPASAIVMHKASQLL